MIKWIVQRYFANLNNVTLFQMIHFRFGPEKEAGVYIIPPNLISFHKSFTLKLEKFNIFRGGQ